jgi:uncharacterized RDD family membrane protein YckC
MGLGRADKMSSERSRDVWWRRAVAAIVDSFLTVLLIEVLLTIFGYKTLFQHGHVVHDASARIFGLIGAACYYPAVMTTTNGRTLGKLTTGVRVVRTDRHSMTAVRATWREVIVKVALFGTLASLPIGGDGTFAVLRLGGLLLVALDLLWPVWDRENRALHDMLAGTRVLRACTAAETPSLARTEGR